MDELLNLETDKRLVLCVCIIPARYTHARNQGLSFQYRITKVRRRKESSRILTGLAEMFATLRAAENSFAGSIFVTSDLGEKR